MRPWWHLVKTIPSIPGLDKLCTCVRGILENSKFSYLRTPYIYILYVHDHHLSSLLVHEETFKVHVRVCCIDDVRVNHVVLKK